jgi:hypothetical protein
LDEDRSGKNLIESRVFAAAVVAFLGAFLLFSLELIVARRLLPGFGGSAHVWTTAMMVFQGLLLAGYVYAERVLRGGRYGRAHLVLLALPALLLPLKVWAWPDQLVLSLLVSIGLPFFVLSTTSTVLQSWRGGAYELYAASNAGSLAALIAYPLLIEPFLSLRAQHLVWSALYVAFAALHARLAPRERLPPAAPRAPAALADEAEWLLLSLGPSAALLAATNLLTLDFAAVPLLWALPLSLYLLTLIAGFKKRPWYPRRLSLAVVWVMACWAAAVVVTVLFSSGLPDGFSLLRRVWVVNKLAYICASLFLLCLICHHALARSRPDPARLPRFYTSIALGGFLGSVLVAVVMPRLARRLPMPELDWALAGALSIGALMWRGRRAQGEGESRPAVASLAFVGFLALWFYVKQSPAFEPGAVHGLRNVYGYYRVVDKDGERRFFHGNTLHGIQRLEPARADEPLLYYARSAPIGEVYALFGRDFRRVGVVGLGVGALAAYSRAGQEVDFFELDPDVEAIARRWFTFLSRGRGAVRVLIGDGRLTLGRLGGRYELLVLDAFSGGAIPVHLLTREALRLYDGRLAPSGVVAIHVTNRFLNLRPVLAALARDRGWLAVAKQANVAPRAGERSISSWIVLTGDRGKIDALRAAGWESLDGEPQARVWTDDYASLLSALRR